MKRKIDWKAYWKQVGNCIIGFFEMIRDVCSDPLARACLLWLLRQFAPRVFAFAALDEKRIVSLEKSKGRLAMMKRPMIFEAMRMIKELGLEAPVWFASISPADLDKMCNGMGPDCFGRWGRELLNWFGVEVIWCSFIHDPAFYLPYNDGTYATWLRDTQEIWERNSAKCVAYYQGVASNWWQRRCIAARAGIIVDALRLGAYDAYRRAFERGEKIVG